MTAGVSWLPEWVLAFGVSGLLGFGAWARRSLSLDGALAACFVGGTIWMGLGRGGFVVLCTFFLTSTLLGRVGKTRKRSFETHYAKGHRRDAFQVFANGGVATLCAAVVWFTRDPVHGVTDGGVQAWSVAAYASLASANADTWATELGVFSSREPWHVVLLRRVPRGTSGAVSGLGLGASLAGATVIAVVACLLGEHMHLWAGVLVTLGGVLGSLLDSGLGGLLQRQYTCRVCGERVETPNHCDTPTLIVTPVWATLGNDSVNLLANAAAALAAASAVLI